MQHHLYTIQKCKTPILGTHTFIFKLRRKARDMPTRFKVAVPFQRSVFGSFKALGDILFLPLRGSYNF